MNNNNNIFPANIDGKHFKITKYTNWFPVPKISTMIFDSKNFKIFNIPYQVLDKPIRNFNLTIIVTELSEYKIFLFEKLDYGKEHTLKLVLYRNIKFIKHKKPIIIYNTEKKKHEFFYEYSGDWLSVNPEYRQQDISLFSYYIYALIIEHVEKIGNFENKNKVLLVANNASSVSNESQHTKCPYCSYFTPAFKLENYNENNNYIYLLNPTKRQRFVKNNFNILYTLFGKEYKFKNTQLHFYLPNKKESFLNIVKKIYMQKKPKQTLGVNLITICIESNFENLFSNWNDFKTISNKTKTKTK